MRKGHNMQSLQNLLEETKKKRLSLDSVSEKLEPLYLVLNPDDHKPLRDLTKQLERNTHTLEAIEQGLEGISTSPRAHDKGGSIFRSFYGGKKHDKVRGWEGRKGGGGEGVVH